MTIVLAALLSLLLGGASLDEGGVLDPNGNHHRASAAGASADAGVRIDPEG